MDFVDTSAWFAYFVPTDSQHDRVRRYFHSVAAPVLTTDYCVDETLTLLLNREERRRALEAGRAFFETDVIHLHFLTNEQVRRAWILFQTHVSIGWSFTDCTSKVVMDELKIKTAVTLDAHFQQFGVQVVP
jgi:uncharacterized protein